MKQFLFAISIFLSFQTQAQTKVYGTVKDSRNRNLTGISITLKDTYDGAVSDSSGKYSFTTFEKGDFILEVKSVGYKTILQKITLPSANAVILNFNLKEEVNELNAVTVTAGTFAASSDRKRVATVLNTTDMYTTAGSNADINTAIKTLPGAQQVGEQAGLFVRGGEGYETKEFIDGTLVNNPYNSALPNVQARSRFDPALFKGNIFSTGGYSALYGEALSSAFILESVDMPERSEAEFNFSPIYFSTRFHHLQKDKKVAFGGSYGYTNVGFYYNIVKQRPDFYIIPEYHNADANFRVKTKSGGIIKYYTSFNSGRVGMRQPNIDSAGLKNSYYLKNINWYNNLSWRENLGNGWKMNTGLSFSTNTDDITSQIQNQQNIQTFTGLNYIDSMNYQLKIKGNLTQLKTVFEKKLFGISKLRIGGEYWNMYNKINLTALNYFNTVVLKDNLTSLFSEAEIVFTNKLAMTAGLRFEYSSLLSKSNLSPRIALAYKTGKNAQMSAAFGTFYQKPETYLLQETTHLDFTKATHYLINYIKSNNKYTFRVEAYYKQYNKLVETYPTYNNNGNGYAKGIEFFWRDWSTFKGIEYWVSYSYLDTKRKYLYYPEQLQPTFATPHTVSVVAKKFITNIKTGFSFTYSFATGRPYYFMYPNGNGYSIGDRGTTKNYSQLDMSVYYVPQAGKSNAKQSWIIFASVKNVLNNDNIYNYEYSHNGFNKRAVIATAPQFYFIGIFLTLGVDRTEDIINRNL